MGSHSIWRILVVLVSFVAYIAMVCVNYISTGRGDPSVNISTISNVSRMNPGLLTPSGWTFSIWGFIYGWQGLHFLYGIVLLFRQNKRSDYLYVDPNPIGAGFYIAFTINCAANIAWIYLFGKQMFQYTSILSFIMFSTIYICVALSHRNLFLAGPALEKDGFKTDIWLNRILVHNGIAFYSAWSNLAFLLGFSTTLNTQLGVSQVTMTWVVLVSLSVIVLTVFILEVFVFDAYFRYTFAHYITLSVALSGIIDKQYDATLPYQIYVVVLLGVIGVLGLAKLFITIYRGIKMPICYRDFELDEKYVY